jgi:phosphoribosylamine--glycine ligase/phosphoribosylformylglycinamidine cyclo-ligase
MAQILILGSGGREHALAWRLAQSNLVNHIHVCPGNPGTARSPKTTNINLPLVHPYTELVQYAVENQVHPLCLISPLSSYFFRSTS